MNISTTVRYNAALTLETLGMNAAVNYVRGHVGGCLETAVNIVDDIIANG